MENIEAIKNQELLPCLIRLAQLQSEKIDKLALQEAVETAQDKHPEDDPRQMLIQCQ